jgi:hypothetical protein
MIRATARRYSSTPSGAAEFSLRSVFAAKPNKKCSERATTSWLTPAMAALAAPISSSVAEGQARLTVPSLSETVFESLQHPEQTACAALDTPPSAEDVAAVDGLCHLLRRLDACVGLACGSFTSPESLSRILRADYGDPLKALVSLQAWNAGIRASKILLEALPSAERSLVEDSGSSFALREAHDALTQLHSRVSTAIVVSAVSWINQRSDRMTTLRINALSLAAISLGATTVEVLLQIESQMQRQELMGKLSDAPSDSPSKRLTVPTKAAGMESRKAEQRQRKLNSTLLDLIRTRNAREKSPRHASPEEGLLRSDIVQSLFSWSFRKARALLEMTLPAMGMGLASLQSEKDLPPQKSVLRGETLAEELFFATLGGFALFIDASIVLAVAPAGKSADAKTLRAACGWVKHWSSLVEVALDGWRSRVAVPDITRKLAHKGLTLHIRDEDTRSLLFDVCSSISGKLALLPRYVSAAVVTSVVSLWTISMLLLLTATRVTSAGHHGELARYLTNLKGNIAVARLASAASFSKATGRRGLMLALAATSRSYMDVMVDGAKTSGFCALIDHPCSKFIACTAALQISVALDALAEFNIVLEETVQAFIDFWVKAAVEDSTVSAGKSSSFPQVHCCGLSGTTAISLSFLAGVWLQLSSSTQSNELPHLYSMRRGAAKVLLERILRLLTHNARHLVIKTVVVPDEVARLWNARLWFTCLPQLSAVEIALLMSAMESVLNDFKSTSGASLVDQFEVTLMFHKVSRSWMSMKRKVVRFRPNETGLTAVGRSRRTDVPEVQSMILWGHDFDAMAIKWKMQIPLLGANMKAGQRAAVDVEGGVDNTDDEDDDDDSNIQVQVVDI